MKPPNTLTVIHNAIRKSDPSLTCNDDSYKAAAVLLASVNVGPNQKKIARLLGYPRSLVSQFGRHLRKSGVWRGRKVHAEWGDKDTGGVAFWCDVCVARGWIERSK